MVMATHPEHEAATPMVRQFVRYGSSPRGAQALILCAKIKAVLDDPSKIENLLSHEDVEVVQAVHYRQYDTYFLFNDQDNSRVRYREDDGIDAEGNVASVRMRLTYTSGEKDELTHQKC